jgi:hypothetical protein
MLDESRHPVYFFTTSTNNQTVLYNRKKNILFVTSLLLAITILIVSVEEGQRLFHTRNQSGAGSLSVSEDLHQITGFGLYDLNGAEASGGANPKNLFDEHTDPGHGQPGNPRTNPLPVSKYDIFFPPGKGYRILIDLQDVYKLTDIFLYDRAFEKDSAWIYQGDFSHWQPVIGMATAGSNTAWGWRRFSVNTSARFLLLRFNSYNAVISEMAMYGTLQTKLSRTAWVLPPEKRTPPDLRTFAGTNSYDYVNPALLEPFHAVRLYQQLDYFDTDTVHAYPKNLLQMERARTDWADSLQHRGNELWMSIRGLPVWMEKKGMHEKDKPVTAAGMNTEDPMSYARHAAFYWQLAAIYGRQQQDTALIHMREQRRYSGRALMHRYENGNEEDGWWSKYYWTPLDYFAASSADYDGHEGKLGAYHGLKRADSNAQLMTSGMIQLDTQRVRTLAFLCSQLRQDKKFIWEGGVQYHYYSNATQTNMQPPSKGISPEADSLRAKLAKVRAFHDRLLPGIPLILGENGYDRNQQSWQRTPIIAGYNEAQSQGIMVIRSMLAAFMAGFDGYNQYMMRSATNDENAPGAYATSGMIGGPANNVIYPAWYYWSTFMHRLGDYQPDAIVSESDPVWIYRLRHKSDSTQKAWVVFSPNGTIRNVRFVAAPYQGASIKKITLMDAGADGKEEIIRLQSGICALDVGESPIILIAAP